MIEASGNVEHAKITLREAQPRRGATGCRSRSACSILSWDFHDMNVPKLAIALNFVFVAPVAGWAAVLTLDRNPLPWPDPGPGVFAVSSPEAKAAVVELLA
ncbi:MAG TPA: hypothetical protein VK913_01760 [Erythrobacter sp.]|nr:hypothetical protein [Erythrobacter sp.]